MQSFKQHLKEAKVTVAKLRGGMVVDVIHSGRSAKQYGIAGDNVFGGKVKVLGLGIVPRIEKPSKKHVQYKDVKDFKSKNKDTFASKEIEYGYGGTNAKLRKAASMVGNGYLAWLLEVVDGENKGQIGYCYISNDDKWEVRFLNKSTEFKLES